MDEAHLAHAGRCVSLNPVRAKLLEQAADGSSSSVAGHLSRVNDQLVRVAPILERYGDFAGFLCTDAGDAEAAALWKLRQSESTGRPIGGNRWLDALERATGRSLKPQKRGPKRKPVDGIKGI